MEASEALSHAEEVSDFQSVGVRCREALIAFINAAQAIAPWTSASPEPKRADVRAWTEHICAVALAGSSQKERRHLFKKLLEDAWSFSNWLTHSKNSAWHDAEAAFSTTENAIGLCTSAIIRVIRGVPEACPACGSHRLSPQRGFHQDEPEVEWERPTCEKCGWLGKPVQITPESIPDEPPSTPPEGECIIPSVPLRELKKPHRA